MSKRILLVEDTEDNRQIIRDLLVSTGYQLLEAEDGAAGGAITACAITIIVAMSGQPAAADCSQIKDHGARQLCRAVERRARPAVRRSRTRREAVVPCEGKEIVGAHAGALEAL